MQGQSSLANGPQVGFILRRSEIADGQVPTVRAQQYAEGHFDDGSMGPTIEAIVWFVKARDGARGVITHPDSIGRALRGDTGTWIEIE